MLFPASDAAATLVPVGPAVDWISSAPSAVRNGIEPVVARSKRSVIDPGGVTLLLWVTSKNATSASPFAVVVIDGAVSSVDFAFTCPPWASIGFEVLAPVYARIPP